MLIVTGDTLGLKERIVKNGKPLALPKGDVTLDEYLKLASIGDTLEVMGSQGIFVFTYKDNDRYQISLAVE
jgi:hypothetical protein